MRPDANCWLPGLKPCSPLDLPESCPALRRQPQPHSLAQSLQNGIPGCRESEDSDCSGWRGAPSSHSPRDPGWGWPPSHHWPSAGLTRISGSASGAELVQHSCALQAGASCLPPGTPSPPLGECLRTADLTGAHRAEIGQHVAEAFPPVPWEQ